MESGLLTVYNKLYASFGKQYWWPAKSAFEVMVGAILTQNTSWNNVEKAIANLDKEKLLSAKKINKISISALAQVIKPAGFHNIKAKRLKEFTKFFNKHYKADIKLMSKVNMQDLRNSLLAVNGIGPETADSILLYALKKPTFVVDSYTKRILTRHKFITEGQTYHNVQRLFMENLKNDVKLFNEYHALLVKLAKDYCKKTKPKCNLCPLKKDEN